ncbi:hypothetical protein [Nonomuraea typhae]|uniref:HEAT repeat domain-containing protein n=1 Tax=Nonomuraea typhae TaxID=2603600 RepID=A0ABW7Z1N0_9ACTN
MTTGAWEAVRKAVDAYDMHAVAEVAAGLGDAERREVARELAGYLPTARALGEEDLERQYDQWQKLQDLAAEGDTPVHGLTAHQPTGVLPARWLEPMRVAGAATIPGAAGAAAWLSRRELRRPSTRWGWASMPVDDTPLLLDVLATRPAEWQADLAVRLALRLRETRPVADNHVRLVLELLRRTKAEPPAHDPLTLAWVAASVPSSAMLAKDPLLAAMVPRLFESEGVGRLVRDSHDWPKALHKLTARSLTGAPRVPRRALLKGCVTRFLRGGQAADLRFFVRLHDLLDPMDGEVADYGHDYLRLLPAAPGPVAELALKQVRRLGDRVEREDAREAVEGLLFRQESKLVRAGLAWLDRLLRDRTQDLDPYAPALATALTADSAVVRERAVRLAAKHAGRFGPSGTRAIRDTIALLPTGQAETLATAFDTPTAPEPPPFTPKPLPPIPRTRTFPGPPATPEDLAALNPAPRDWTTGERWLAAFVHLAARDRSGLRNALKPLADGLGDDAYSTYPWHDLGTWTAALARELTEPGSETRVSAGSPAKPGAWSGVAGWVRGGVAGVSQSEAVGVSQSGVAGVSQSGVAGVSQSGVAGVSQSGVAGVAQSGVAGVSQSGPGAAVHAGASEPAQAPSGGRGLTRDLAELGVERPALTATLAGAGTLTATWAGATAETPASSPMPGNPTQSGPTQDDPMPGNPTHRGPIQGGPTQGGLAVRGVVGERLPRSPAGALGAYLPLARFAEVYEALVTGRLPPYLLSTPTRADGGIDAAALVERLEGYERTGVAALPLDLRQAVLRLRRGVPAEVIVRARGLTCEAARWLTDRPADPRITLAWTTAHSSPEVDSKIVAGPEYAEVLGDLMRPEADAEPFEPLLSALAGHRELVAAHYLATLSSYWADGPLTEPQLRRLALADGPTGPATGLLLAWLLLHGDPMLRTPFLWLSAAGALPGEEIGKQLAALLDLEHRIGLPTALDRLRELAEFGAHQEVWQVMSSLLTAYLPGPGGKATTLHTRLVTFAADAATWAGARGEHPAIAELATRTRTSELVRQARRLHTHLTA